MNSATFTYEYTKPDKNGDIKIANITVWLNKEIVAAEYKNDNWTFYRDLAVVREAAVIAYETLSNENFQLRRGFRRLKNLPEKPPVNFDDEEDSNVVFVP
jgi:hypothetical protein